MNVEIVVGLSNLGPLGQPRDDVPEFDPMMEREAAEALIAEFRREGLAPPAFSLSNQGDQATPRAGLARVNVLLASMGLPTHPEPAHAPEWKPDAPASLPIEAVHRLRRVMAHQLVWPGRPVPPLGDGLDAREDAVMKEAHGRLDNHLIHHADREGFFLPISFSQAVHDPTGTALPGGWVGSSQRLAEELAEIAPLLDLEAPGPDGLPQYVLDRVGRSRDAKDEVHLERWAWLVHAQAAQLSVRERVVIIYA